MKLPKKELQGRKKSHLIKSEVVSSGDLIVGDDVLAGLLIPLDTSVLLTGDMIQIYEPCYLVI